jgi:hypothetical protein
VLRGELVRCGRSRDSGHQDMSFLVGNKSIFNIWAVDSRPSTLERDDWAMAWGTTVETYSRLDLSYPSDLLPALSGVAKQMQLHRKSRYIAGMWEDTLMEDLLWDAMGPQQPRPQVSHSPTWSWLIVSSGFANGKARMFASGATYDTIKDNGGPHTNPKFRWFASLDEVSITPVGQDHTGQVKSGYIVLLGSILPATLDWPFGTDSLIEMLVNGENSADGEFRFRFRSDYSLRPNREGRHVPTGTSLHCLKMAAREKFAAGETVFGTEVMLYLVLRCVDEESGVSERIGLLTYALTEDKPVGWYTELEEIRTVKII